MGKLHELLAVEPGLRAQAQRAANKAKSIFTDGRERLIGRIRTYQPTDEEGERFEDEIEMLVTTVSAELAEFGTAFSAWIDAAVQKEVTNQGTGAAVMIDDNAIIENLPATALLNLESKLVEIRQIYAAVPVNDAAQQWDWDDDLGCYTSRPRVTYRTKKVPKSHVLYEATPEHPAQVEMFTEDVRVGTWTTAFHSGAFTPQERRERLARIDTLLRAIKAARQRANNVDVTSIHVAEVIFKYIDRGAA